MRGTDNPVTFVNTSGDDLIDGILTDYKWTDTTIYYSFPTVDTVYDYSTLTNITDNFSALSKQQIDAANFALNTAYGGDGFTSTASAGFSVEGFTNLNFILDSTADTTSKKHIAPSTYLFGRCGNRQSCGFPRQ